MILPVALFSRVPFRDSFLGVKCRYKGGDLFKKCLGVPKETPFSGVKGAKYSVILVLLPNLIHSSILVLSLALIHSVFLVLSSRVIHSSAVILSISVIHLLIMILFAHLIHSRHVVLSSGGDSFRVYGTFRSCTSFGYYDTFQYCDSFSAR